MTVKIITRNNPDMQIRFKNKSRSKKVTCSKLFLVFAFIWLIFFFFLFKSFSVISRFYFTAFYNRNHIKTVLSESVFSNVISCHLKLLFSFEGSLPQLVSVIYNFIFLWRLLNTVLQFNSDFFNPF